MALQKEIFVSGKIGNVVFYKMRGKFFSRSAPEKVMQTPAMKVHANTFGRASGIGRVIRQQLLTIIPFPKDSSMQIRLVSPILAWLKESGESASLRVQKVSQIERFQFTLGTPDFITRWKTGLEINRTENDLLEIKIPAFIPIEMVTAPNNTISVKLKIAAGAIDPDSGEPSGKGSTDLLFNYDNTPVAEQTIFLNLKMPVGSLVITGACLEYSVMEKNNPVLNTNKSFMPAAIVKAMYIVSGI